MASAVGNNNDKNVWNDFDALNADVSKALKDYDTVKATKQAAQNALQKLGETFNALSERGVKLHQAFEQQEPQEHELRDDIYNLYLDLSNLKSLDTSFFEEVIGYVKDYIQKYPPVGLLVDKIEKELRAEIEKEQKETKERAEHGKKSALAKTTFKPVRGPDLPPFNSEEMLSRRQDPKLENLRLMKIKEARTEALKGWHKEYPDDDSGKKTKLGFREDPNSLKAFISEDEVDEGSITFTPTKNLLRQVLQDGKFMRAYHFLKEKFREELQKNDFFEVRILIKLLSDKCDRDDSFMKQVIFKADDELTFADFHGLIVPGTWRNFAEI